MGMTSYSNRYPSWLLCVPSPVERDQSKLRVNRYLYFVAYTSEMGNPPLVFVLSEKDCSMLLFPFTNKDGFDLVECVLLPDTDLG